ncbi:MAG: cytochrome c [Chromatiales bacterium]|nr:cytochrome c [Chromatiales bacterium]
MRITTVLFILTTAFSASVNAQSNEKGREIFKSLCMTCHKIERSPQQVAPPIFAMKDHYLRKHPDKASFVHAVTNWLIKPSKDKALMPGAIRKFNLMPKPAVSTDEAAQVATFLFELNLNEPDWYQKHYKQDHPNQ